MKSFKSLFVAATFIGAVFLIVFVVSLFFNRTEAQSNIVKVSQDAIAKNNQPVAWNRKEIAVNSVKSGLRFDLTSISSNSAIAVKPIRDGEKERMYAGIVTWEEMDDQVKGFLRISKIENYPLEKNSLFDGMVRFNDNLAINQALVVYLETSHSTRLFLEFDGKESVLSLSEGAYAVFNGEKALTKIDGPSSLLNELHIRKLKGELSKNGHTVSASKMEEK